MKIVHFSNIYFPFICGVSVSLKAYQQELESRGHTVYIFAPSFKNAHGQFNHRVVRYPSIETNFKINFSVALKPYYKIDRIIKQINPDIIHAHQSFWLGREALKYSRRLKRPLFYTYHANYEYYTYYLPIPFKKRFTKYLINRDIAYCNKCSAVVAPSKSVETELLKREIKTQVDIIPTGINLENFKNSNVGLSKLKKELGINAQDIVLLFLARLEREKNIDLLIEIIPKILKKYKKAKFLIVGDGSEKKRIQAMQDQYKQRLILTGRVDNKKVAQYYKLADLFIQTSFTETQGLTTLEALASGLAVIAVEAQGNAEFVLNGENGYLVKAEKKSFLQAVDRLIKQPKRLNSFQEKALEVAEQYDIKKCANRMIKLYMKHLMESGRKSNRSS
ncbi:MAG: glycosyltransferase [Candidatus Moranbacteria bacterium]|nr:glycosyltransferase [Candidatus Moranbacteria bacterium]